jgi:hypothetical protein
MYSKAHLVSVLNEDEIQCLLLGGYKEHGESEQVDRHKATSQWDTIRHDDCDKSLLPSKLDGQQYPSGMPKPL